MPPPRTLTQAQVDILLSFMDAHRDLASCMLMKNAGPDTKREVNELWEKLTSLLNAEKGGIKKSCGAWRRYWNEKKYSVRRKALEIQRTLTSGQPVKSGLNSEELKILEVMGRLAGKGGMRGVEIEYSIKTPMQDEDSTGLDPLDQSSNEEKFKPSTTEPKPTQRIDCKPILFNFNGISADQETVLTPDVPPQWAIDIEERRTAASERLAASLEQLTSAVLGMHQSMQTLTQEVAAIRGALVPRPP